MKLGEQSVKGIWCVKFVGFMFEACEIFHWEAVQLDLAGDTIKVTEADGDITKLYILVMTWPASYYTYATLISDMTTASFCEGIVKGLQFFDCKPDYLVIDNAKL